jgi:multidrug efflux pump subunit AcrA (membrane-fusion protein)
MTALRFKPVVGLLVGLMTVEAIAYSADEPGVPAKGRVLRVPSPRAGIVLAVGTQVDKSRAGDPGVLEARVGDHSWYYRRLVEGDKVTEGQVLAQLDDRAARDQIDFQKARLVAAQADLAAASALYKEAQARLDRLSLLIKRHNISAGEYSAAVLTRDKRRQEEVAKKLSVEVEQLELERAQLILEMHTIRSPVSGVVHRIRKRSGEAVRKLETLLEIRTADSD